MNQTFVKVETLYEDLEKSCQAIIADPSAVQAARKIVENALGDGNTYYGINTGFGALANKRIMGEDLTRLQKNLILSHAAGVGNMIPKEICRLILELKIHSLGLGYSGISTQTLDRLLLFLEKDLIPVIPEKGSLGASGDLAPLAHMSLPLLGLGEILESHRSCGKVQDPYSLRCVPQVHGASRDALKHAISVIETEINSVTDNPLVFQNGDILSGGNFHGQPLALSMDFAKLALAELASISERRTYLLLEGNDGLPQLLMSETGINSGFMIPQYTSAALVSENKVLCHPSSVDSIPTSLGQEDHVSMGSISALHLFKVYENVETVLAIELFTSAQALDFRKPLKPGRGVEIVHQLVRETIPHATEDHYFKDDINKAIDLLRSRDMIQSLEKSDCTLN